MAEAQILKSKEYETIYILRPDVDAESAERVQNRVAEVVARDSGKLVKVEAWGRRKLAYPVARHKRGVYIYVKYLGKGGLVQEVERNLRLQDAVLKFQTVLTNADIDAQAVQIDPEEVKFQHLDLTPEEEKEESRERALGLLDPGPDAPRRDREDDFADPDLDPELADETVAKEGEDEP